MGQETLRVREIRDRRDKRTFIHLAWPANASNAKWSPPLVADEWHRIDPNGNPALTYCDMSMALAERSGRAVGRIMGIVNRRHNAQTGEQVARFGSFDCIDDPEAAHFLLSWVEAWAREHGCTRVVGPMGFTDQDPEGMLIDGFDEDPGISTLHGPEYLPRFVEAAGYSPEVDYVTYVMPTEIPERVQRIAARLAERGGLEVGGFSTMRELTGYAPRVFQLMNDAYRDIYGYVAMDDREIEDLIRRFVGYLDSRFVFVVEHEGQPIGFAVGMPHITPGIRRANGRLFPFGFFHIWRAMKSTEQINMLLGGVHPDWRGKGVDVLLGVTMITAARAAGYTRLDSQHVLESNTPMRSTYENWGGRVYKRHRIYQKSVAE